VTMGSVYGRCPKGDRDEESNDLFGRVCVEWCYIC